jgi:His-Xaa-Ser system radical SAM maturase HxsC
VTPASSLASQWQPGLNHIVPITNDSHQTTVLALQRAGVTNLIAATVSADAVPTGPVVVVDPSLLEPGDVVALEPHRRHAEVLMREGDQHHTLFLTNRCNSRCLMCSQPPTDVNDAWRSEEAIEVIQHMTWSPPVIGFTGGEPLLLGSALRHVLRATADRHPHASIEVLTNGRLASDGAYARDLLAGLPRRFCWMVPLYGHAPFLHDHVVQAEGAFDETLLGLLNLQRHAQLVQLRVVLIRPVLEVLPALADFIARNLPFVREVALMGCEPVGFALANRDDCEVDLGEWQDELRAAVRRLQRGAVPVILMNTPLCGLSPELWPFAHRSISDWKNTYAPACEPCQVKRDCCGLFAWHARGWTPNVLNPVVHLFRQAETSS